MQPSAAPPGSAAGGARSAAPSSLRERKKDEVRASLVEAALTLARDVGWDSVTTEAIATRAGVSRRTFFRYFSTKEAVILARRAEQLDRFRAELAEVRGKETPSEAVRRACTALADDYQLGRRRILAEHGLFRGSAALVAADLELDRAVEEAIVQAVRARAPASDERRARLYAAAVVGVLRVVIEEWASSKGKLDLARVGGEALDLLEPLASR